MNMFLESACRQDKVGSCLLACCHLLPLVLRGICGEEGTPGKCIIAGTWGLNPCGFLLLAGWAVWTSEVQFLLQSTAQTRTRIKWLVCPCHHFPLFRPGFLLGLPRMGTPLGSGARFVLLHQLPEMQQFRRRSDGRNSGVCPGQFHLRYHDKSPASWRRPVRSWRVHVLDPHLRMTQVNLELPL